MQLQIYYGLILVLERHSAGWAWAFPAWAHQSSWLQQPSRWRAVLETSHQLHSLEGPLIPRSLHDLLQGLFREPLDLGKKGEGKEIRHCWNSYAMLGPKLLYPSYTGSLSILPEIHEAPIVVSVLRKHRQIKQLAPNHTGQPRDKPKSMTCKTHLSFIFLSIFPDPCLGSVV